MPEDVLVHFFLPRVVREDNGLNGTIKTLAEPFMIKRLVQRDPLLTVKGEKTPNKVLTCYLKNSNVRDKKK